MVDEIRGIGRDPTLRGEVWQQVQRRHDQQRNALRCEQVGLKRELTRHHGEIRRLITQGQQDEAPLADLHDRIARAEARMIGIGRHLEHCEQNQVSETVVVAALADFDELWKNLQTREQAELLQLLVTPAVTTRR